MVEYPDSIFIATGERFRSLIKYFDYGVVSIELELDCCCLESRSVVLQ